MRNWIDWTTGVLLDIFDFMQPKIALLHVPSMTSLAHRWRHWHNDDVIWKWSGSSIDRNIVTDVLEVVINVLFYVRYRAMFILFIAGSKMRRLDKKENIFKTYKLENSDHHSDLHKNDFELLELWSRLVLKLYNKMKTLKIVLVWVYQKLDSKTGCVLRKRLTSIASEQIILLQCRQTEHIRLLRLHY